MRTHTHVIDNNKRGGHREGALFNRSFHLWLRKGENDESFAEFGGQLVLGRLQPRASARFHLGTRGSETPIDAHLDLFGNALYLNTSIGRRFAHWATGGAGRDLTVRLENGRLSWVLWRNDDSRRRGDWRNSSVVIDPLTLLFGRKRYTYADLDAADVVLELPEGQYPVRFTLQRQSLGRPRLKRTVDKVVVDWDAPAGIPSHDDRSGGWKGDRTYGSAFEMSSNRDDWYIDATALLAAWVMRRRAQTGFRQAQEA